MLPLWRKTKSAMVATSPLLSGQEMRRMAEGFMPILSCSYCPFCVVILSGVRCREGPVQPAGTTEVLRFTQDDRAWFFLSALQFFQYLPRGIRSGPASQSHSGMRATATQVQVLNRRAIARPVQQRTHGKELVQRQFPVKDLPARHSVLFLEVEWGDDLVRQNHLRQIGSVLRQRLHHGLAKRPALTLPIPLQLVGSVLHVDRHHVLALGRKRGIG